MRCNICTKSFCQDLDHPCCHMTHTHTIKIMGKSGLAHILCPCSFATQWHHVPVKWVTSVTYLKKILHSFRNNDVFKYMHCFDLRTTCHMKGFRKYYNSAKPKVFCQTFLHLCGSCSVWVWGEPLVMSKQQNMVRYGAVQVRRGEVKSWQC